MTTDDGTTISDKSYHVNKVKNVTITASWDSDSTADNNWASNQCSSVYCLSSGQASPSYVTVSWGTTISNCES